MEPRRTSSSLRDTLVQVMMVTALMGLTVTADFKARYAGILLAMAAFAWLAVTREREDRPQELRRTVHVPGTGWPLCSRKTLDVVGTAATFCLFATANFSGRVEVRVAAAVLAGGMVLAGVATGWNGDRVNDLASKVVGPGLVVMFASCVVFLGLLGYHEMGGGVATVWTAVFGLPVPTIGVALAMLMMSCLVVQDARKFRDGRQQNESGKAIGSASPEKTVGADGLTGGVQRSSRPATP